MNGLLHRMRRNVVLVGMIIMLAFLLVLMTSPGFQNRKAVDQAMVAWSRNQSAENERAIRFEQEKGKRKQYLVGGLAVLNVMAIAVYGGMHRQKRERSLES